MEILKIILPIVIKEKGENEIPKSETEDDIQMNFLNVYQQTKSRNPSVHSFHSTNSEASGMSQVAKVGFLKDFG